MRSCSRAEGACGVGVSGLTQAVSGVVVGVGVRLTEIGIIFADELVLWNNGFRYCPTVIRRAVNI